MEVDKNISEKNTFLLYAMIALAIGALILKAIW